MNLDWYWLAIAGGIGVGVILVVLTFLNWLENRRQGSQYSGTPSLVGKRAEVIRDVDRKGTVFVDGAYWSAESDVPIRRGEVAVVTAIDGLTLKVEPESRP
jgi:membrane protein implicated in regulation of membrane protease activity